jgi:hypothetical protein
LFVRPADSAADDLVVQVDVPVTIGITIAAMYQRTLPLLVFAFVLMPCAGCSITPAAEESHRRTSSASEAALPNPLATYSGTVVGMDAAMTGTLRLIDGCLATGDPGSISQVLVFPQGEASWRDGVLTWRQYTHRVGDTVQFGGGAVGDPSQIGYLPPGCADHPAFLVGS